MKKRVLSMLLCLCMVCSLFAVTVFADDGTLTGEQAPITVDGEQTLTLQGCTIEGNNSPAIYVKAGATLHLVVEGENTLTGAPGYAAICVEPAYDAEGDYDEAASGKVYISGSGNLTANGGDGAADGSFGGGAGIGGNGQHMPSVASDDVDFGTICVEESFTGELTAVGGTEAATKYLFGGGAGIGGGGFSGYDYAWGTVYGVIALKGGTIHASARSASNGGVNCGSGIGSGSGANGDPAESCIRIDISGGNVTAVGGRGGAGIGGGDNCDGGEITISGKDTVVHAEGGEPDGSMGGAGIGGGASASVSKISITGGDVTAVAGGCAAGIGSGTNGVYSAIHYGDTDGTVSDGKFGIIEISGKDTKVQATGGSGKYGGAGIGAGYPTANNARSIAFHISITDGATVTAQGGYHAQSIGYGCRTSSSDVYYTGYGIKLTIDDTITLKAQNEDDFQPALVAKTPYDENPITYRSTKTYVIISTGDGTAEGYLTYPSDTPDMTFTWTLDGTTLTLIDEKGNEQTIELPEDEAQSHWAVLAGGSNGNDDNNDDIVGGVTASIMIAGLDTDDHIAYVYGYPDGTVRPNGTITRAEVTTIFYRLLTNARRDEIFTSENSFSDVDSSKWYNKAASSMAAGGYIQGYSDGTFGADKPITRAEFVAIASRFASKTTGFASYSDVDNGHWAAKAIAVCASNGWVQGYEDGTFRPDQPITRAEAMTIINRMLGRGVSKGYICKGAVRYPDNEAGSWYYYEVLEATNDHEYRNARPFEQWIRTNILRSYDMDKYERP